MAISSKRFLSILGSAALVLALSVQPCLAGSNYFTEDGDQAKAGGLPATQGKAHIFYYTPETVQTGLPAPEGDKPVPTAIQNVSNKLKEWLRTVVVIKAGNSLGSGFFVSPKGDIITNAHVVAKNPSVQVYFLGEKVMETTGEVIKADTTLDLAHVRVNMQSPIWLQLATLQETNLGEDVMAIGAPKGLTWSVSKGIVSAVRFDQKKSRQLVQTDAAINPGNSGGPLIQLGAGKVVGVNTMGMRKDTTEGLNFAVASQEIAKAFPGIFQ